MVVIEGIPYSDFGVFVANDGTSVILGEIWGTWPIVVKIGTRNEILFNDEVDYFVCPD